jgi:hypothetical protein
VGLLALVLVATIAILPGVFWELHRANAALHGFSDALVAKDYGRAYGLTSPTLQSNTKYDVFVKIHRDLEARFGDLKQIEIGNSEVNDRTDAWYGTAEANMIFAKGQVPFIFTLKKEKNEWKIYGYREP